MTFLRRPLGLGLVAALVAAPLPATAQDAPVPAAPAPATPPGTPPPSSVPPDFTRATGRINMNFVEADLGGLVKYIAASLGQNFVLADTRELESKKVTIIAPKPVTPAEAYEAFLSALQIHGLSIVKVGGTHKIIQAQEAQQSPGRIREGGEIPATDQYITQIIPLENVSVSEVREIVDNLVSQNAKVLAYAPTNTMILTDTGYNIRRIYDILMQLDIAAPRSTLEIYPIVFAEASEIKALVEELYGTAEEAEEPTDARARLRRRRAARRNEPEPTTGVTAGKESNYISKVLSDDRTNTLIALANENGHQAIRGLISRLDIDVDPQSRSQIYVYRLEHAKAEDVAQVLQDLGSGSTGTTGRAGNQENVDPRVAAARARREAAGNAPAEGASEAGGAIAAFEGIRIAPDENTNALVIIASRDDYEIIRSVIDELDIKRKQVFVDAVILELSSQDSFDFNLAYHTPFEAGNEALGVVGGQFGTRSLGFSPDMLNGLAFGIFGQSVDIPIVDPTTGLATTLGIPAFGIALQAIKTMQMVNIVSTPSLLALDNEEARIVVGRKIPFPTSSGLNSLGQPVVSYQREDVAITLEVTPRINSENFVTLELNVEVQEIEESDALDVNQAGFITSNRQIETSTVVGDNQTMVLGGLVSSTESESEAKIPILGDLPILGALFRNRSKSARRSNLMVFLTPHIIDDEDDMREVMRVKEAQRQEFMRRFYGKSQDEQFEEIRRLLQYSMNAVDRPSVYRGPATISTTVTLDGKPISAASRDEVERQLEGARGVKPGEAAGTLPPHEVSIEAQPVPVPEVVVPAEPVVIPVEPGPLAAPAEQGVEVEPVLPPPPAEPLPEE